MEIIYSTFSLRQKIGIWISRLAIIVTFVIVILHISERPILIGLIAIALIALIIIVNEEKIVVYKDKFIFRKYYFLNLYGIDKEFFFFKDLMKLETEDRTMLDEIVSGFQNMGGSNLYIYFNNGNHKTLKTGINYSEICEIIQIVNNRISIR